MQRHAVLLARIEPEFGMPAAVLVGSGPLKATTAPAT